MFKNPFAARSCTLTVTLAAVLLSVGCPKDAAPQKGEPSMSEGAKKAEAIARRFVLAATEGRGEEATALFDAKMNQALTPDSLRTTFKGQIQRYGSFAGMRGVRVEPKGKTQIVHVDAEYAKATTVMRVVVDADGHVSGLWFDGPKKDEGEGASTQPVEAASSQPALDGVAPVQLENGITEEEVVAGTLEYPLGGTLTLPKGDTPAPAVVLIHGSGPHDRDETIGPNKPFLDIARGLAERGIATYRFDKRAFTHAQKMTQLKSFTVFEESVEDAGAAVRIIRPHTRVDGDKVFVLGHSLGGMLIPRIATVTPNARGYIILAGTTRPMEDVIVEQLEYIGGLPDAPIAKAQIDEMKAQAKAVKALKAGADPTGPMPFGIPASYWLDLKGYDPAAAIAKVNKPVLALQGGRDYQVTQADFSRWTDTLKGKKGAMYKFYPDLNHLFASGQGKSVPAEYEKEGHVSKIVLDDIAAFVKRASR